MLRGIAVVDDRAPNRLVLKAMIEHAGYKGVYPFSSPEEYLAAEDGWDMTFTDNVMPGMSGVELIEKMRERGETHPVCMVSANISAYPGLLERLGELGADHMQKPVDLSALKKYLKERLGTPTS